jgi:hypothetical protein
VDPVNRQEKTKVAQGEYVVCVFDHPWQYLVEMYLHSNGRNFSYSDDSIDFNLKDVQQLLMCVDG